MCKLYLRKRYGSHDKSLEQQEHNHRVTATQYSAEFEYDCDDRHGDAHLCEAGDEPRQPVHWRLQTHHTHYLCTKDQYVISHVIYRVLTRFVLM